jgi:Spy/CpxP family protein refolding chaperone
MRRPVALLSIACVFLVGILVGALGTHLLYVRSLPQPAELSRGDRPGPGGGPAVGPRFVERMTQRLGLSEEQRREIDEILRQSREESDALHDEMLPVIREQLERTRQRIFEVLTPEQREEFERLRREHRGRTERFFLGGESGHRRKGPGRRGPRGQPPPPGPPPPGSEPPPSEPPPE